MLESGPDHIRETVDDGAAMIPSGKRVVIRYTNYRGETSDRRIIPLNIVFASTEWHPEDQWLLEAFDVDKGVRRLFAMKDILNWPAAKV